MTGRRRAALGPAALAAALVLAGCGGGGAPTSLGLRIAAMHITQGTQTVDGKVPLVQDRPGCLRVFVLSRAWAGPGPAVRVHVRDAHGHEVLARDILPPGRGVPAALRDSAPGESWDLPLPGEFIRPDYTVQAELLVPAGDPVLEPGQRTFPHDGTLLRLDVRPVPPLRLTLVPIRTHGRVGRIEEGGRTLESWTARLRALYPLANIDLRVGPEFDTAYDFSGHVSVFLPVLRDLDAWRTADGRNDGRHFYGVIPLDRPTSNGQLGLGYMGFMGRRTAIGLDGIDRAHPEYNYDSTLAHELGHNFGRSHAPCGVSPYDLHYPNPSGHLDVCGYDLAARRPLDPSVTTDIMGYCGNKWVSRYTYEAVLRFRDGDRLAAAGKRRLAAEPARDCLLVWGGSSDGRMELTAALRVHRKPLPAVPGDYQLECVDAAGQVVQSTPFGLVEMGDERDAAGFTLVVPMPPGGEANLAELRVTHEGQVRAVLRPSGHAAKSSPGPKAHRGAGGVVHFTWDASAFPRVLVQDPQGASLALGSDGSLDLHTGAKVLECTFSDGLHSVRHPVPVD